MKYFSDLHYVWCAPFFTGNARAPIDLTNPASSIPSQRYWRLVEDIKKGDRHSVLIKENIFGIKNGILAKEKAKIITRTQGDEIRSIIQEAQVSDFRPLIYIIPFTKAVRELCIQPHVKERAHPLAEEFVIKELPRSMFDIIELDHV
ncbi:MAG: hypothetical protein Q8L35_09255 [Actinomycetota bacterium]|nr:hypothetical protein [Actinomycetota bacterium]